MTVLEKLLEHRAIRQRFTKPYKIAKKPAQPLGAEKAYVADLHRLVGNMREATTAYITPHLALLANARTDDATNFNEFIVFSDTINRISDNGVIVPLFQKQADRVATFNAKALGDSMGIQYGAFLGANTNILSPRISDFIDDNTDLIQTLSRGYVDRVADTLTAMQGSRAEDISSALQRALDITESHADLIAVDQTLKLNADFTSLRQQQVGVTSFQWATAEDERVRPDHQALDGQVFSWNETAPVVDTRSGRREFPGKDFRCRCQALAIVPGFN